MLGIDFAVNTDNLGTAIDEIGKQILSLEEKMNNMGSIFGKNSYSEFSMNEDYATLQSKYKEVSDSYSAAIDVLNSYKQMLEDVNESAKKLCTDIADACNIK